MKLVTFSTYLFVLLWTYCYNIKLQKSAKSHLKKQDLMALLGSLGGGSGKKKKHKKHDDDEDEDDENMSYSDVAGLFSSDLKNLKDDKKKNGSKNQIDLSGDIKFLGPSITPEESNMNMSRGIYGITPPSNNNYNSYGNSNYGGSRNNGWNNVGNSNYYNPAAAIEPSYGNYYRGNNNSYGYNNYNNYNSNSYGFNNNSNYRPYSEYDSNRYLPRFS